MLVSMKSCLIFLFNLFAFWHCRLATAQQLLGKASGSQRNKSVQQRLRQQRTRFAEQKQTRNDVYRNKRLVQVGFNSHPPSPCSPSSIQSGFDLKKPKQISILIYCIIFLFLYLYPLSKKKLFNAIDHGQNAFTLPDIQICTFELHLHPPPSTLYGHIVALHAYIYNS